MADLKCLGFILTLAAWVQESCHAVLGWCSTGRGYLPEAADKVVQSAVDASVSMFHRFVAPIVPKAQVAATSWLVWVDDKMQQRFVVVIDFYETRKGDIAAIVAQLKANHGERLESFMVARERVSSWFKGLAEALKEQGVRGGSGFVAESVKKGAIKVSELGPVAALMSYCKELWSRISEIAINSPSVIKLKELSTTQLLGFLQAHLHYLKSLPELAPIAAANAVDAFSEWWAFGVEKADALLDTVVASPRYAKAVGSIGRVVSWAQSTVVFEKISSVVAPYAMPAIEMVDSIQLFHDFVERMRPIKSD